jgi:hypothetical protein
LTWRSVDVADLMEPIAGRVVNVELTVDRSDGLVYVGIRRDGDTSDTVVSKALLVSDPRSDVRCDGVRAPLPNLLYFLGTPGPKRVVLRPVRERYGASLVARFTSAEGSS